MSFFNRLIFGTLFFLGGWLFIGFMMIENGSASRYNPAWQLIGPFYHLIIFILKWSFYAAVAFGIGWLVLLALKQWAEWQGIWLSEEEKRKLEDERKMEQLAIVAERETQRLAH